MSDDDDIHSLSGAYSIDAVDDVERARFEAHLAGCSACRAEVRSLRAAGGELALGTTTLPPPSLRASVLQEISSVRPLPPANHPGPTASLDSRRLERAEPTRGNPGRWLASVAAAAAIVIGGVLWHPFGPRAEQGSQPVTAAQQVLQANDTQRFEKKAGAATMTVVRSPSLRKAVIVTANLPAAPAGKVYELWLQQGPTMVPAGFVTGGPSNTVVLQGDATTAAGAGITIEPTGGSAKPSLPPVALVTFA